MAFFGENEIAKNIIDTVNGFLSAGGFGNWRISQAYQPNLQGLEDQKILLHRIHSRAYGWQGKKDTYNKETDELEHTEIQRTEVIYQFTFFKRRRPLQDGAATLTAADMAEMLRMFLMSEKGIGELAAFNYGVLRISEIREAVHDTDSQLYEKFPSFDMTIVFERSITTPAASITSYENGIHRV